MIDFLRRNARWLGAGLLLTFASAFGQTWFISLFAGEIRVVHGLTDGQWGSLYTLATLASAALLFARGALADTMPLGRLAPGVALLFAVAAVLMAFAPSVWVLGVAVFGLRFCGQGMFGHIAMTAMGRWFRARRGRAVAVATLGHPAGEFVLPLLAVLAAASLGARATWLIVAAFLAFAVAPAAAALFAGGRAPEGVSGDDGSPGLAGRHWTRSEALAHWLFPALLPYMLTGGFISTVIYFHMVHIAGEKGWTLTEMAPAYPTYAVLAVAGAILGGWAADRFGPDRLLAVTYLPMAVGVSLIGPATSVWLWFPALGLLGLSQGIGSALWGALLPAVYGARHLGAVRSLATTIMVFATAIGPGLTGLLIDAGVALPRQTTAMALWCFALCLLALPLRRRLSLEAAPA
jgi:sugar phosphate permease